MAPTVKSAMSGWTLSKCLVFVLTVSVCGSAQVAAQSGTTASSDIHPLVSPEVRKTAWEVLAAAVADNKLSRRQNAIVAVSTIGTWSKAVSLVESLLRDKDSDVRALAAAALAEMNSRRSIPVLRRVLEDSSPAARFAAAKSLWQLGDHSGREILTDILQGDSSPSDGVIKSNLKDANKKLHNPKELAFAGMNAASGLLGPFSYGITMAGQFATDRSASARALSASLLASDHSPASVRELRDALQDKNTAVRAAAAKALGQHPCRSVIEDLHSLLDGDKDEVKYMAAASLLRISTNAGRRHAECESPTSSPAPAVAQSVPESAGK
ncbi:MAG TPA: HEAT repeat domain-containing protein [Terriglobales bacterium]|jgi:HEAT repeat protein|nr:HEAT repeat domain-containing protein [Terriglobales bacterium]